MVKHLRRENVRYALFPLLLLAIIVTGLQSSHHQLADKPGNSASAVQTHSHSETHHHAGDVDGNAAHLGADDSTGSRDPHGTPGAHGSHNAPDGGPLPACHELENPQATASGRCSYRGVDQEYSPVANSASWEAAEHRPSECASRDVRWAPPPGPGPITTLCVLRI